MAAQARLHDRADVDDGRIAGDQSLGGHLAAAQKNRFDLEAVLVEESPYSFATQTLLGENSTTDSRCGFFSGFGR